jgi:nitroimidazol reductase NimA-like FMN-containing flavoprotein (pyridoxamine 5'-phosphate oxidase superfamily)
MPRLTDHELTTFLDEPGHLLRLATTDEQSMPLVVPVWFIRDGDLLLITPRARSAWFAHLRRDNRTCFSIDEDPAPYRKVTVRGTVEIVHDLGNDDQWRDIYRTIACRYVTETEADAYLRNTKDEPRALLGLRMSTSDVSTWRMPIRGQGENPASVWAAKYYTATDDLEKRVV